MEFDARTSLVAQQITARMHARPGAAAPDAAQSAAKQFETEFLTHTVEEMLKSVDIGSFGGGHAEETWRSFLARAYAEQLAGQGVTGIAQSVETTIEAYRAAQRPFPTEGAE